MGNTEHLQRRDISFVSFIAILEFALALAAPSGGDALLGGVSVPAWYTFYVNKLFAGLPLLLSLSGYLWSVRGETPSPLCKRGSLLLGKADRLLYPYWLFTTILYFVAVGLPNYLAGSCPFTSYTQWVLFPRTQSIGYLWILPALFWLHGITLLLPKQLSLRQTVIAYGVGLGLYALGTLFEVEAHQDPLALVWTIRNAHFFILGALVQKIYRRGVPGRVTIMALLLFHVVLVARILTPYKQPWILLFTLPYFTFLLIIVYGASSKVGKWIERPLWRDLARFCYPIILLMLFNVLAFRLWIFPLVSGSAWGINLAMIASFVSNLLLPLLLARLLNRYLPRSWRTTFGFPVQRLP